MDRLFLSYWLRGPGGPGLLRHVETALGLFPFSRLSPGIVARVWGVSFTEPVLAEQPFPGPPDPAPVLAFFREFQGADIAYEVETRWDLWQFESDWKLAPVALSLFAFAPRFERGGEEQIRLEFGPEFNFLPSTEVAGSGRIVESNIRSLLKLVHDLDEALPAERRQLWTETGENFADRLERALREYAEATGT
ncbi:MAG: hypothetical protein SFV54_15010 [Bryobacteraceae bacterium]|nr:hypothetical protein [Bryobacteraceae bacterium]